MVFRSEDIARGRTKVLEEAVKDPSPELKLASLGSGIDKKSEKQLAKLLGEEKAKHVIQRITEM